MATRDRVLAALAASSGPVSGEAIAASLGVSRAAVAKHIKTLRLEGCTIEVVKGTGYRLASTPESAVPAGVAPLLRSRLWTAVHGGERTESTNDDARALAVGGAAEGTLVVAAEQGSGRGRLGRHWESPTGGAYVSFVLRPDVAVPEVSSLALAVALGVADGIERLAGGGGSLPHDTAIKWPNDVLLGGKKVAGILLELSAEADAVQWVVVGIGLNVSRHPGGFAGASYLADVVADVTPASACAAVLDAVADRYSQWLSGGFVSMRDDYGRLDALQGSEVVVSTQTGEIRARGMASGVDEDGRLLVSTGEGGIAVASGEVTLRSD